MDYLDRLRRDQQKVIEGLVSIIQPFALHALSVKAETDEEKNDVLYPGKIINDKSGDEEYVDLKPIDFFILFQAYTKVRLLLEGKKLPEPLESPEPKEESSSIDVE